MDKLALAHEWAMKHGSTMMHKTVIDAWAYADAMQAEVDKRNNTERPKVLFEPKCEVDWNQAPKDATHYVIFADGLAYWHKSEKLECFDIAPSFGIVGMCVMERPHGI